MKCKYDTLFEEKSKWLKKAYQKAIEDLGDMSPYVPRKFIMSKALAYSTPRFFISEDEAMKVLRYYKKHGKIKVSSRDCCNEQFRDLLMIYESKKKDNVFRDDYDIMCEVVSNEAPRMYINIETAFKIYNRMNQN